MKTNKFLLGVLLIAACTPTTRVMVLKPPQAGIKNIQRVAVIDLVASEEYDEKVIKEIRQRLVKGLKKNTSYKILDPELTDSTLKKEKFTKEDYQQTKYAGRIGPILGVDTLIYGAVLAYDSSDDVEHVKGDLDPTSGQQLFKSRLKFIRLVDVAIKFEIVSIKGEKTVTKTLSATAQSEKEGIRDSFAKEALEPESDLFRYALEEVSSSLTHLIAPHYVEEEWPIKTGTAKNPKLIEGIDYAKEGEWDKAESSWEAVIDEEDSSPTDRDAAKFNLGLLAESYDKFEIAAQIFQELHDKNNDSDSEEILERIKSKEKKKDIN